MVAVVQPRFFSHFREVQQYFSDLGLPKGMLEILPGITQAQVVAQGGLCLQFTGSSAMFRGLASKAYDLGNFGLQQVGEVCVLSSRSSFLTSERCGNISLNLVYPRACWRYCLVSLRHELLRKVDCLSSSRDHRPCFVASFPKHTILATLACSMLAKCADSRVSVCFCCDFGTVYDCSQESASAGQFD